MAIYQDKDEDNKPKQKDGSWYFRCYYSDIYGNRLQKKSKKYFKKFISYVDNDFHYTMFSFLYYTGLRIRKMIALCWKDINFERKTIPIYKIYTNRLGNNTHKLVDPKTKNSIRIVDLDDDIINLLKKHYESEKNIYDFNDNMFIFGNVNPITPTTFARYLSYYIKKLGVKKLHLTDSDIHTLAYYSV